MHQAIDNIRKGRLYALSMIEDLSEARLSQVPPGFSNNILWNLGHLVAAQEGVCYKRNGLDAYIAEEFWQRYRPGSHPQQEAGTAEIALVKQELLESLQRLQDDYTAGKFSNPVPWTTRYGIEIATIEDALNFLQVHDGMHLGYIMALRKLI